MPGKPRRQLNIFPLGLNHKHHLVFQNYLSKTNPPAKLESDVGIIIYIQCLLVFAGIDCHKPDFIQASKINQSLCLLFPFFVVVKYLS